MAKSHSVKRLSLAYDEYLSGHYLNALKTLETTERQTEKEVLFARFLKAVIFNRLGNYWGAERELMWIDQKAKKESLKLAEGLHYELAQAQYALGKWKRSAKNFVRSIKQKYQVYFCLFYVGKIFQQQGYLGKALRTYEKLLYISGNPGNIKQLAWYEMAEVHFAQAPKLEKDAQFLKAIVLPRYYASLKINPGSDFANTIKQKIIKIQNQLGRKGKDFKQF